MRSDLPEAAVFADLFILRTVLVADKVVGHSGRGSYRWLAGHWVASFGLLVNKLRIIVAFVLLLLLLYLGIARMMDWWLGDAH